jgi:hypothetical protein
MEEGEKVVTKLKKQLLPNPEVAGILKTPKAF